METASTASLEKLKFFEKTLSLSRVELGQAKNQDDGTPVIQVSFETNKLMAFTDKDGNIASGDGTPQVNLSGLHGRISSDRPAIQNQKHASGMI